MYDNIALISSYNEICLREKRISKNTTQTFYRKNLSLEIVEKYSRARQVTYDNIKQRTHFICLINKARIYKHTQNIWYCFPMASMVALTHYVVRKLPVLLYY